LTGRCRFRSTSFDLITERRKEEDVVVTPERLLKAVPNVAKNELTHAHTSQAPMQMHFGETFEIRDLGSHGATTVTTLALLLAGTVDVRPDPKRKNFYEVVNDSQVYYIHVSPVTGIIYLLALWENPGVRASGPYASDFLRAGATTLPDTPTEGFQVV
jgi:hypothetical protein